MSSRARIRAIVAAAALAAGGIAVAVAWTGRGEEEPPAAAGTSAPREGAPPLALDFLVEDAGEATALQRAVELYQGGKRADALAAFDGVLREDPGSLYAAVGAAFSRWPGGALPELRRLEGEHPASALVSLHLGLALFWQGKDADARAAWARAERVEPDSAAAVRAESLLHPDMPAGRPFFVPSQAPPADVAGMMPLQQLDELERRARERGDAASWILYGVALQRAGRPVSAQAAFDRAVAAAPEEVEAQAAAAVVRFTKADPAAAFSRLGPLGRKYPHEPVIEFHLGLMLLWLGQLDEARTQLSAAAKDGPATVWGREAGLLIERLTEAGGQTTG